MERAHLLEGLDGGERAPFRSGSPDHDMEMKIAGQLAPQGMWLPRLPVRCEAVNFCNARKALSG